MFEVFTTRWDDPHVVEQIPATGLSFNLPLSEHGEASMSATVGPGRNFWRAALSCAMSGCIIASDGVPVWAGMMTGEQQSGPRTFDLRFKEWGSFFAGSLAAPFTLKDTNDHVLQRRLISDAQAFSGQDVQVILGTSLGAATSDLQINEWDSTTTEAELRRLGEAEDGPEWYFAATGTMAEPTRTLVQGDRLGSVSPVAVLEYVEETADFVPAPDPPSLMPLSSLTPSSSPMTPVPHRRGGNVIAHPARQQSPGVTVTVATGTGEQVMQMRKTAFSRLLVSGFPRRTSVTAYSDVKVSSTLIRHARADLAAAAGMVTGYSLATWGTDPDWSSIARGDTVRVELDTDVYGDVRPLTFTARVLDIKVSVQFEGPPLVTYVVADMPGV